MRYVFLVEEKSMKTFLDVLLAGRLPDNATFRVIPHDGKGDLKKSISSKLHAMNEANVRFVILIDQDSSDCYTLKEEINSLCQNTGADYKVRIVCRELEAWYLGDLTAVDIAFSTKLLKHSNKKIFRQPDILPNAKQEFKRHIEQAGQIETARKMAEAMRKTDWHNNKAYSFHVFLKTVGLM